MHTNVVTLPALFSNLALSEITFQHLVCVYTSPGPLWLSPWDVQAASYGCNHRSLTGELFSWQAWLWLLHLSLSFFVCLFFVCLGQQKQVRHSDLVHILGSGLWVPAGISTSIIRPSCTEIFCLGLVQSWACRKSLSNVSIRNIFSKYPLLLYHFSDKKTYSGFLGPAAARPCTQGPHSRICRA